MLGFPGLREPGHDVGGQTNEKTVSIVLGCSAGLTAGKVIALTGGPAVAATCKPGAPPPADPYPGKTVVATNFESGSLAPFTPYILGTGTGTGTVSGTVSVSSTQSHSPG